MNMLAMGYKYDKMIQTILLFIDLVSYRRSKLNSKNIVFGNVFLNFYSYNMYKGQGEPWIGHRNVSF